MVRSTTRKPQSLTTRPKLDPGQVFAPSVAAGKVVQGCFCVSAREHPLSIAVPPEPSGGEPLPPDVLNTMEALFGTGLSDVRIHVGTMASSIGALAFTSGRSIYFAPGRLNLTEPEGISLLAHELTHVVQQRAGRVRAPRLQGNRVPVVDNVALEAEAERMAVRAAQTFRQLRSDAAGRVPHGATGLVRQPLGIGGIPRGMVQPKWADTVPPNLRRWVKDPSDSEVRADGWYRDSTPITETDLAVAIKNWVREGIRSFGHVNIEQEVNAFAVDGKNNSDIVDAAGKNETTKESIAIFQYLYERAHILNRLLEQVTGEVARNSFLLELQSQMNEDKIHKGLFAGQEDRGMFALGLDDMANWLQKGKQELVQKTQPVPSGRLAEVLNRWSYNLDSKSYGRRLEALENTKVVSHYRGQEIEIRADSPGEFFAAMSYPKAPTPAWVKTPNPATAALEEWDKVRFADLAVGRTYYFYESGATEQPEIRILEKSPGKIRALVIKTQ